ncbi:MAG TPA: tRNA (adenosine(37)-N6)-threonylcarbamoyltransferase complex dimerization subunit type 1 TsaB [Candidatus Binatia bacterium]|nr:tRNA (adenosine(37)-N6)-threonylcarbamoyltransferase complex dimerization subunit type 1 TsaB [Candidatus Binatia bacterium]
MLAESVRPDSRAHVAILPALTTDVLAQAGLRPTDVEAVAVSIGPGSFTGLRIGLAFAKGIAFAGGVPMVAVPTLEALAAVAEAPSGTTVCAALDARKRECWTALFRVGGDGGLERLTDDLTLAPAALADRLPEGCILVGDAGTAYADVLGARALVRPFSTHHPRGGLVARLGAIRLAAGERADTGTLEPVYGRPPDAEPSRKASR